MLALVSQFKKRCLSACRHRIDKSKINAIDKNIALGVLFWAVGAVAEADGKFALEESKKIKEALRSYSKISEQDFPIILTAIRQAAIAKIDFYRFTKEVSKKLSYDAKMSILENLFHIASADNDLDDKELKVIEKISNLFDIEMSEITGNALI